MRFLKFLGALVVVVVILAVLLTGFVWLCAYFGSPKL